MAQIILNIDSPVALLQGKQMVPMMDNYLVDEVENLRSQVLPHLLAVVKKNTFVLPDQSLNTYVSKVASKFERAWLTNLAANIAHPSKQVPLSLMTAVELRYLSELILDDIADISTERCGIPTLHLQVGISKAIYLAEILMGAATESLGEALELADVSKQLSVTALKSWGQKNITVSLAQYQDLTYGHMSLDDITPDMSLDLINGTTAQDLANCFFLGGLVSGSTHKQLERLQKIGQCIGMLMQIRDDLLDYVNDANVIYKEPLLDFRNGRKKVPMVVAFHHASDMEKQEILALCQQADFNAEDITRIQQIILNPTALAYQANLCNEFIRQIEENLDALGAQGRSADIFRSFVHKYFTLAL